ncbi:MAG: glycerate kinase, partial [Eubacteriales bacterium]|nr:glycerate kinase [Eubacteriales bacterium]
NPLTSSTCGVGQLIRHALTQGCRHIYVGLGGSATNDGGAGMATALGARFVDQSGNQLPAGGAALLGLCEIDMDGLLPQVRDARFYAVSDVDNPLCGPQGASAVFGPQKGATPGMVPLLDEALARLGRVVAHDLGADVARLPGAGAAGGLGAGMMAFCNATLLPGADFMLDMSGIDAQLKDAHLVLTGEGKTDAQTLSGKAPLGVARRARRAGVPVICLSGALGEGWQALQEQGFAAVMAVCDRPMTLEEALPRAAQLLEQASFAAGNIFLAGGAKTVALGEG